jgi:hypothetical protein
MAMVRSRSGLVVMLALAGSASARSAQISGLSFVKPATAAGGGE